MEDASSGEIPTGATKVKEDAIDPRLDFVAGTVAGAAGLIVGQPLDTIKVRFQSPQFAGKYRSTGGAFVGIIRDESVRGLFKGVWSPMAGIAFMNGLIFASYGFFMTLQTGKDGREPSLTQIGLAGAGSGLVASLITTPTELVKIRQQSFPGRTSPTTMGVVGSILRQEGLRGLYRGLAITSLRDLAYGPYFLTYEAICRGFRAWHGSKQLSTIPNIHHGSLIEEAESEIGQLNWAELMFAGGVAGATGWMATFPLDVIKTRIQNSVPFEAANGGGRASILQVARATYREGGTRPFFAGLGPTLIRAFPTNMVIFLSFELIVAAFK